ncbi:hypothetical protein Pla163_02970 [Planctomycetes bacterium Pla163]|jgi:hypothetical protein|uniref:FG-GAP repeat protein n=1 Tax=Rohdeia mirabilis TaxID=2528008 RepID=A0A518CVF1_9BACT|nr:hypothetical protein Pla163_02970 [Planctomycetes bacterium Pla163]
MLTTIALGLLLSGAQDAADSLGPAAAKARGPRFAAPVMVRAGDAPLNGADDLLYPSPVLFDVDGDGDTELVVGDLWGNLFRYERIATDDASVRFGPRERVQYFDGANVELPNW